MDDYLNQFLFGYYPYIALSVFIIGSIARYEYAPYGWKSSSSQLLRKRYMRVGSNLFHVGILLLFLGHLFGLLTPVSVYHYFVSSATKQLFAMVAGGVFGTICFVGLTLLILRRLLDPRIRSTSTFSDILILILLFVQLVLGMLTITVSADHMDGGNMVTLASWVQGVLTFQPQVASLVASQHIVFKLHLFLGLTIFLVFPFTRLIHIWSVPIGYIYRTGYQIVRKRA
jgi:nitrate reductase gamma subunit